MEEREAAFRDEVAQLLEEGRQALAAERVLAVRPADAADVLARLSSRDRLQLVTLIPRQDMARIAAELPDDARSEMLEHLPDAHLIAVLDAADDNVVADVLRDLSPERSSRVLRLMSRSAAVAPLLAEGEETAGGHMTRAFVSLRAETPIRDAIDYARRVLRGDVYARDLYVTDADGRLEGVLSLKDLIIADPSSRIADVMRRDVISAPVDMDQEDMARTVQRYDLFALPVVDASGRLVGVVTVDDVLDVVEEEATEDFLKFAGVGVDERALGSLTESMRRRLPWLAVNMAVALCGALVVNQFDHTIAQVAALAVFMPVIAGQGGNAGVQTATIVVRGLALDEVRRADLLRVLSKELALGAVKGVLFGLVLGAIAFAWKQNVTLGVLAGVAMFLNMMVAGIGGVLIPMTLRYVLKIDPATAAGVFDTMLTDIMGFFIFLGLATLFIGRLT